MEEKFIKNKFTISGTILTRQEILSNGKIIVFEVALPDLSTMQFADGEVDFDEESDKILEKFRDSQNNMVFRYTPSTGFDEIDIDKQQHWLMSTKK